MHAIHQVTATVQHTTTKALWALLATALIAISPTNHAQKLTGTTFEFSWDEGQPYKTIEKVKFANGDFIQVAEGKTNRQFIKEICEYKRLEVRRGTTGAVQYTSDACDSVVHIRAAYPDTKNAKLAIVTTNCGGTMCRAWNDYFVVFLNEAGIRVTRLGTGFYGTRNKQTKYQFSFNGQKLSQSLISNFYDGKENNLGDLIASTRYFIPQGEYVDTRLNKKYLKFVGQHPEVVLSDIHVREKLVSKIQPERFRAIRAALSGPGVSSISNGRFIVMNACMRSNCTYEFGAVVLDGFTGALHAIRFNPDEQLVEHVSTEPLDPNVDGIWLSEIDTQQRFDLSIEHGRIRAKRIQSN